MENAETQRELLGLPEYVFPAAMLVFGYPTEQQLRRPKPERADLKYIVCENRYEALTPEATEEMFTPRCAGKSYTDWMRAFCDRKYNSDFSREMTRSVKVFLEAFQK
jgi:hypothetical protein